LCTCVQTFMNIHSFMLLGDETFQDLYTKVTTGGDIPRLLTRHFTSAVKLSMTPNSGCALDVVIVNILITQW